MHPTRPLSLAALIFSGTALFGYSDTLLTLAPEPVRISPLEQALANSSSPSHSVFSLPATQPILGSLTPPCLETEAQRSWRLTAETLLKVGAVLALECPGDIQVRPVGCPDIRPSASR
jgi:hypothetical protein